jgi:hypothetical protein
MKLRHLTFKNMFLFAKGYYAKFVSWQYSKMFGTIDIARLMRESAEHAPCVIEGTMKCCGCDTVPKLMAGGGCEFKKCNHGTGGS